MEWRENGMARTWMPRSQDTVQKSRANYTELSQAKESNGTSPQNSAASDKRGDHVTTIVYRQGTIESLG